MLSFASRGRDIERLLKSIPDAKDQKPLRVESPGELPASRTQRPSRKLREAAEVFSLMRTASLLCVGLLVAASQGCEP